jgi:hypothetical protein
MTAQAPHLSPEHFYGRLVYLKTKEGTEYYFQNFQTAPYSFEGENYLYLPFSMLSSKEDLEISSSSVEIMLANTETLRNLLRETDIRGCKLRVYTIFPEEEGAIYETQNTRISSYSFQKGVVNVSCRSPVDAISNQIPSKVFDPEVFPELPYVNSVKTNYRPL